MAFPTPNDIKCTKGWPYIPLGDENELSLHGFARCALSTDHNNCSRDFSEMNYWLLHPREPLLKIYASQLCLKMAVEALFISTLHELSGIETLAYCKIAKVS